MTLTKSQKGTLLFVGISAVIIICITQYIKSSVKNNSEYTIGYVFDSMNGPSSGPAIYYYYYVDGKKYDNSDYINSDYDVRVGEFYWVKYSSEHPNWAEIQQNLQVIDSDKIKKAGFSLPQKKRNQFQE
ncbi:hypothetical protein [Pseudozobellia thermophila]|uniref:Uncharacterized protein n=1 Tax=Pseudozobellia thermophila TaxID=192903 RepID=A0A1M6P6D0_9FLAO|nr:hypothetical protein [Pseudozobellia thermophila]SHK03446.1 hypothetical protein SAMN04488513_11827 [Pseudozobellia thermophila]